MDKFFIHRKFKKILKWGNDRNILYQIRGLKPTEFEQYIANLFSRLGYQTEAVGKSHDGGIDVIAEKDNIKHYIQCKKFITREVGVSAIRDFYGAMADKLTKGKGYFITTNKFTLEAEKFAEDKPIELIDGFKLLEYIKLSEKKEEPIKSINTNTKQCPKCSGHLVERTGKFGSFFGCSNYPKCGYTKKRD